MRKKKHDTIQQRQGDVLVVSGAPLPEGAVPIKGNVLAEGELTGHAHRIGDDATLFGIDGELWADVRSAYAIIEHGPDGDHGPFALRQGTHQIPKQREYVAPDLTRNVAD